MTLSLRIIDQNRLLPEEDASRTLEHGKLTIGRGAHNTWVLVDPERVISTNHCVIEADQGQYVLTDTSSNGVFVNGSNVAIGPGNSVVLNDGDQLRISHHEVEVRIESKQPAQQDPADESPFSLESDESALFPGSPLSGSPGAPDDGLSGILNYRPGRDRPADLLDDPVQPQDIGLESSSVPGHDEDFSAAVEQTPSDQDFFQAPATMPNIPEDWNDDWNSDTGADLSPQEGPAAPGSAEEDPFSSALFAPEGPETLDRPAPEPAARSAPPLRAPVDHAADTPLGTPARAPEAPSAAERRALEAFLRGAGLEDVKISEADVPATLELLGQMYREVVKGLMEVLAARSTIKNEFRLSQTTIQPAENNPLKFSLGVDDAMTAMLSKRGQGYLPPLVAVEESFEDIKAHQVAVLAGMQVALSGLLKRFDPGALEQRISEDKGLGTLLKGRKSRYWDEFTKMYENLVIEAEDDFQSIFGREFGRAYEEQVSKYRRRNS